MDSNFKELSAEDINKMSADEQIKYFNDLSEYRTKRMNDLETRLKKEASDEVKSQIEALKAEIIESNKEQLSVLQKALKQQGEALALLMKNGVNTEEDKSLKAQIKSNLEGIKKAVDKTIKEYEFVVKANTTRASVADSTQALRLTDVGQLATRKLVLRDLFPVVTVGPESNGTVRYADWDEATKVRAAAMVAEGGTFPESTAAWAEYSLDLKKIGDTIPVTEEMVQDAGRFSDELRMFLEINVALIEDAQLLSGSGAGNNLNGVYTTAGTYSAAASGITDANIYDLIVKMSESITTTGGSKYTPNFALMNIADINLMKLKKDANNNYIIPPFVSTDGKNVAGITVIECNALTADTMVLGDSRYAKIYEVEGFNISVGYSGDQFVSDLMTLKARKRENLLIRTADVGGFKKCTGIAAALATLATDPS